MIHHIFQLYQEGHKPSIIAERCDVSLRTVRRWVRSFEKESVKVTGKAETPATEVLPALERIANPSSDTDTVSVNIIPNTAVRLLNLAQSCITAVEAVLNDSNSSDANKLRAAALASKWIGLEANGGKAPNPSVITTVTRKTGTSIKLESSEASEIQLTPLVVINKREQEELTRRREAEAERKRQEEEERKWEHEENIRQEIMREVMSGIVDELAGMKEPYPYEKIISHPLFNFGVFFECLDYCIDEFEDSNTFKIVAKGISSTLVGGSTEDFDELYDSLKLLYPHHFDEPYKPYLTNKEDMEAEDEEP